MVFARTFEALDECGNLARCITFLTFSQDQTPPTVKYCDTLIELGCNVNEFPEITPELVGASDECGEVTITILNERVNTNGCRHVRVLRYQVSDACGNVTNCRIRFSWLVDEDPPVVEACQRVVDLGCNPRRIPEPNPRRLRPTDVIAHFEGVVMGELDLRLESAAASEFAKNTEGDAGFGVPVPLWDLSSRRVMTLGWVEGIALGDVPALKAAGHDLNALAERVLQLFLSHALRDGFFHADMHQGNLKVSASGDIIAYDFGIMGHIDEYTRRVYAEILIGFIRRDYRRVAEVHFEAGYVPADRDIDEFARALRAVGEPIFGMDASRISMARLLSYLFEVTERFGMQTRTELILLQRTMVVVEGVARSLDPNMNIWESARPVVERYIKENIGPRALIRDLVRTAQVLGRFGPRLPQIAEQMLTRQTEREAPAPRGRLGERLALLAAGGLIAVLAFLDLSHQQADCLRRIEYRVGGQRIAGRAPFVGVDGRSRALAGTYFFSNAFELDDVGVDGHTDREGQTCQTR